MPVTVLVAAAARPPELAAHEAAAAIGRGVRQLMPRARVLVLPLVDGGTGFAAEMVRATQGYMLCRTVCGVFADPLPTAIGFLGGNRAERTAVIDVATAMRPPGAGAPGTATRVGTSRGVGELIEAALDARAHRILIGCGGGVPAADGGLGMLRALGARWRGAPELTPASAMGAPRSPFALDRRALHPRLAQTQLEVAVGLAQREDSNTPVLGLRSARSGLPASLAEAAAWLGARLRPCAELAFEHLDVDASLARADLLLVADQPDLSPVAAELAARVLRQARRCGVPHLLLQGGPGSGLPPGAAGRWLEQAGAQALGTLGLRPTRPACERRAA
jgi:glycerate kinase